MHIGETTSQIEEAEPKEWDSLSVRATLSVAAPILAKLLNRFDVDEEDIEAVLSNTADRLLDLRALVYGGELTRGASVRGLLQTERQLDRIERKLDQVLGNKPDRPVELGSGWSPLEDD